MAKASNAIDGLSSTAHSPPSLKSSRMESSRSDSIEPTILRKKLRRLERAGNFAIWMLDILATVLAWQTAILIRNNMPFPELIPFMKGTGLPNWLPLVLFQTIYTVALLQYGCYGGGRPFWLLPRILKSVTAAWIFLLISAYVMKWQHINRPFLFLFAGTAMSFAFLEWLVLRASFRGLKKWGVGSKRVLVAGSAQSSAWVLHDLTHSPGAGVNLLGLITDDEAPKLPDSTKHIRTFKGIQNTARLAAKTHAEEVVLCLPDWPAAQIVEMLQALWPLGVRVYLLSPDLSVHLRRADLPQQAFHGLALLNFGRSPMTRHVPRSKRASDIILTSILLLLGSPILLLISLIIWITDGRPLLYRQERVGTKGRRFNMWKFRTMHVGAEGQLDELKELNEADGPLFKIKNDPRVTRFGAFLRRHSLDELPQLWNVMRGEMSLIGPRPPIPGEVEHYEPWHHARLAGAVGCSGLWQVSGRSDIPFEEMAMLDIYYLHNMGPRMDIRILIKTIWTVLVGQGAY